MQVLSLFPVGPVQTRAPVWQTSVYLRGDKFLRTAFSFRKLTHGHSTPEAR